MSKLGQAVYTPLSINQEGWFLIGAMHAVDVLLRVQITLNRDISRELHALSDASDACLRLKTNTGDPRTWRRNAQNINGKPRTRAEERAVREAR